MANGTFEKIKQKILDTETRSQRYIACGVRRKRFREVNCYGRRGRGSGGEAPREVGDIENLPNN